MRTLSTPARPSSSKPSSPMRGRAMPLPPLRPGSLNLISTHDGEMFWSQVFVNNLDRGRTPLTLDLMPGR